MGIKRWSLPETDRKQVARLTEETGLPEIVCRVLWARGHTTKEDCNHFFFDAAALENPFLLKDMDKAVERVSGAVERRERIAVYGDYDCDGVTATALLTGYFQSVGADAVFYIPSRERDGYGLNRAAVKSLADMGVGLIVTVDNGISAHDEIEYANSLGMDVVVTDHHTPRDTLPPAVAVVNPHRADCPSPYKDLAGVGVALKLVCALEGDGGSEMLEYYSDLAALGTVADVVPLTGENRIIVRHGLAMLQESQRPGVGALLKVSGLSGKPLTGESAAFGIIPRINAAGRMGDVEEAVELLLTDDAAYAQELAAALDAHNARRKQVEEEMLREIDLRLARDPDLLKGRLLIVAGEDWHHGVVGIAAAKLVEKYGKPCILFSLEKGTARGSGRSIEGYSLIEAISACSHRLTQFGGHTLAAGLTLPEDQLDGFAEEMQRHAKAAYPVMPVPQIFADCALSAAELTPQALRPLAMLEPFGSANQSPVFLLPGLRVEGIFPTSDGKHIRIRFSGGQGSFYAVYFRMTEAEFPYRSGDVVDVLAGASAGEYMGKPQVSVRIRDVRPQGVDQEALILDQSRYESFLREEPVPGGGDIVPTREDLALIYKYIRKCKTYLYGEFGLYLQFRSAGIGYCKVALSLDILEEMGLALRTRGRGQTAISIVTDAARVDLGKSGILSRLAT